MNFVLKSDLKAISTQTSLVRARDTDHRFCASAKKGEDKVAVVFRYVPDADRR